MHKIKVGVLRGGPSSEYEVSLKTGATVLKNLSEDKYEVRDIFIDKTGIWHMHGTPRNPHDILDHLDVVFNALHGHYGEDGKVQHVLEIHQIPFTGSGSFASSVGINKKSTKDVYDSIGLKTPKHVFLEDYFDRGIDIDRFNELFQTFAMPVVVKPVSGGSSVGTSIVKDPESLEKALQDAFGHSPQVLLEECIFGKEATCGVVEGYRDIEYYTPPIVEIRAHNGRFFDYEAKYGGKSEEIVPGNFSEKEKKEIERMSVEAHKALGLRHYSRSDFMIHPTRGVFILETNTLPGLTEESLLPKSLASVGASVSHFLDHLLELAISKK